MNTWLQPPPPPSHHHTLVLVTHALAADLPKPVPGFLPLGSWVNSLTLGRGPSPQLDPQCLAVALALWLLALSSQCHFPMATGGDQCHGQPPPQVQCQRLLLQSGPLPLLHRHAQRQGSAPHAHRTTAPGQVLLPPQDGRAPPSRLSPARQPLDEKCDSHSCVSVLESPARPALEAFAGPAPASLSALFFVGARFESSLHPIKVSTIVTSSYK